MNNNNNFKMKVAEWRGYVAKALEDLDDDVDKHHKILNKRIDKIELKIDEMNRRLTNQTIKYGIVSGLAGMITGGILASVISLLA